mmetsp:Transcript_20902/g.23640  ORF Transcript_20902/g.23640 Transcript_20902/m.23640 type:complete len:243 (+) Transcript_20902:681-1409(+)
MNSGVSLELSGLLNGVANSLLFVIFVQLRQGILSNITVLLFDLLRYFQQFFSGHLLSSISQRIQNKVGNISTCKRDMLDATSDDISIYNRNDMGNTVARINNSSRQALSMWRVSGVCGGGIKGQYGLHCNVHSLNIEGLKENFRHLFTILGSIHGRFRQQEVMFIWFYSQIIEDTSMPELFHTFPIVNDTTPDGIAQIVSGVIPQCFVANIKIEIGALHPGDGNIAFVNMIGDSRGNVETGF